MKFENVQANDQMLLTRYGYSDRSYHLATVTKVTKTRFTVQYGNGEYEQVFTKDDGREFPRSTGYSRTSYDLKPLDDEGKLLIKKYRMSVKARNLANKLGEIFENANFRNNITSQELDHVELDESIRLLEQTYERFKKYGPKEGA